MTNPEPSHDAEFSCASPTFGTPVSWISECVRQPHSMYAWAALVAKSAFSDNEISAHARRIGKNFITTKWLENKGVDWCYG
jgi:hypothetical protein